MKLMVQLRLLAGRLRIIQIVESSQGQASPEKVATRSVTLAELTSEIRAAEVRALAELPAELTVDFTQVFDAAGIKPAGNVWTIEKLRQLLATDQYKAMTKPAAQQALLGLLSAEKVAVQDLVKDALARDQAIDAFENFVRQKLKARMGARDQRVASLESQIRSLQEECARLREEAKADRESWRQWHARKTRCEQEMAWAISYLVDGAVVSVDDGDGEDHENP